MHHAAEITFYDELGVAPNATQEQIRDSFRALVRILHPDHQTDEQLKEIAERQMRKLNRIYAVLSDAEKRRRYNESLADEDLGRTIILSPNSNVNVRRLMERIAWIAALTLVVITLLWLSSEDPAASQSQSSEKSIRKSPPQSPPPGTQSAELAKIRSELHLMQMERDAALLELTRLRAAPPGALPKWTPRWTPAAPVTVAAVPVPTAMTELPPTPQPALALPAPVPSRLLQPQKPASATLRPFSGFWFYMKPATTQHGKTTLYPPEFIETTITEQNGTIRGRYRSRYKIVDRAISPDVSFEFAGLVSGSTVVCPWTGPGGAKGELTLKIAGDNSMLVDWSATELGSIQGLITGTATLTRRID